MINKWINYKRTRLSNYVDQKHIKKIKNDYLNHYSGKDKNDIKNFIYFLFVDVEKSIKRAIQLTQLLQDFRKELSHTSNMKEREKIILKYAYQFSPSKEQYYKDELAIERWFDEDALAERMTSKSAWLHRRCIVALERIGSSIELLTQEQEATTILWNYFDFNKHFLTLLQYKHEPRLRHQAFTVMIIVVKKFNAYHNNTLLDEQFFQYIYRVALSHSNSVWVRNDALEFLALTEFSSFLTIAKIHASCYKDDDTIFVRHKIAKLAFKLLSTHSDSDILLKLIKEKILNDTSPYVRQAIVKQLSTTTHPSLQYLKEMFIIKEKESSVRALAILQVLETTISSQRVGFQELIHRSLFIEKDTFVLKTALHTIGKLAQISVENTNNDTQFISSSIEKLSTLILGESPVTIKRFASMIRELLWVCSEKKRYYTYSELYTIVQNITPSKGVKLPKKFLSSNQEELYRILSVISQHDFSLELRKTLFGATILSRSERMGRRAWRIIYELRNPSPDKREAFPHTIARIFEGTHHFPSSIMAEQAPTKVPGEPYFVPSEESSRPYLPLADHYLSSLKQPTWKIHPFYIYSSDGITTIYPPKNWWSRVKTDFLLTWNYATIARLRNWQEHFTEQPNAYVNEMKKLGFKTVFKPYIKADESTNRFFSFSLPLLPFISLERQESFENYFVSAYENSLGDLTLFIVVIFAFFFIRHVWLSWKITRARSRIALSVGGWGTRGKSGTERLKAALFNALGLRVFSKTTGNEAMFLHSESFEGMREMYLFRPYDKATIWEQADTILIADKLEVDVYLWESMGLTPSYVEVLQKRWMKDDIATITNTYPDHENLQGPAGINIPQVMTNFIPYNSTLVTTEEVMYPILKAYAKSVNTPSFPTGWLQAGLIAPDILSRFPYEEHPYNIALVLVMAEQLDIDEEEALKAMADNIVPDLGVLKAYPPAQVGSKRLHFINGMSANERFGALGNWKRMGLYERDDEAYPDSFLTTVINNRADRVSRSRVFASMIVEDIIADCHILIGSNLSGFFNYLDETWQTYQLTLSLTDDKTKSVEEKVMAYAKKFRLIRSSSQLKKRLEVMLNASTLEEASQDEILENYQNLSLLETLLSNEAEIWKFYQEAQKQYTELEAFKTKVNTLQDNNAINQLFRDTLWIWLKARVKPLYNYHATGNEVVQTIADHTPVGMLNTIIGMQNIKGTGLDFAYRWVAWDSCYQACLAIKSSESEKVREGVETLAAFGDHGPLTYILTQESIEIAKQAIATQTDYYQAQIQLIETTLKEAQEKFQEIKVSSQNSTSTVSWLDKLLGIIESFLDAGDAVKRRKRANLIYKDLINHHISHKKAAMELQAITKRQKGGWFVQKFK